MTARGILAPGTRWWLFLTVLALCFVALDVVSGPYILFPITFAVPVVLAAWHLGLRAGILFAVAQTVLQLALTPDAGNPAMTPTVVAVNVLIRLLVLLALAGLVGRLADQSRQMARRLEELETLLPICSFCKKIRRTDGGWESLETYVGRQPATKLSHGLCEACARQNYPDVFPDAPPGS